MVNYLLAFLLIFSSLNAAASPRCSVLFKPDAVQILSDINDKYSSLIFNESVDENIKNSSFLIRSYKLFKLKRLLRDLEKNGEGFDSFELSNFVFKLDKLAFAEAVDNKLSLNEKAILSESRRSVMSEGLIQYFGLNKSKSGFFKKFSYYFSQSISWQYWRWTFAWMGMPKLVGTVLPPELAHKILLDGVDAHRFELEKYLPQIKSRTYFNKFSKIFNIVLVTSLFTIVPYMVHDYYQEQMKIGAEQARLILEPLVQTTNNMAQVDQLMQKELGALEKYIQAYELKYGNRPTEEQIEAAKQAIILKLRAN